MSAHRYSANFFAKDLLPRSKPALDSAARCGTDPSRICLQCWRKTSSIHLDDEAHVLMECPAHGVQREAFASQLSIETSNRLAAARTSFDKLLVILGSAAHEDWELLGRFVSQVRQARRRAKLEHEKSA